MAFEEYATHDGEAKEEKKEEVKEQKSLTALSSWNDDDVDYRVETVAATPAVVAIDASVENFRTK